MKRNKKLFLLALLITSIFPILVFAQATTECKGLVPCCDPIKGCGWNDLMILIKNVLRFLVIDLSLPIAAIMFAYSGFLFLTSGGNETKRSKGKKIFINVFVGILIAMAAWLIVNTVLTSLIDKTKLSTYSNLQQAQ